MQTKRLTVPLRRTCNRNVRADPARPGSAGAPRRSVGPGSRRSTPPAPWGRALRHRGRARLMLLKRDFVTHDAPYVGLYAARPESRGPDARLVALQLSPLH